MFEGNLPENSMAMIYDFDIASILYKLPDGCMELQDQKFVNSLIAKSVDICHVLGHQFKIFKKLSSGNNGKVEGVCKNSKELKAFQMRCFYTGMLIPLFNYNFLAGSGNKKKQPISVVQHILANSLTRPNEVQKFVLETCKGVEKSLILTEKHNTNNQFLEESNEKLDLGWYLREFGHRWIQIQLVGAALEYCKDKPEGSVRQINDDEFNFIRDK